MKTNELKKKTVVYIGNNNVYVNELFESIHDFYATVCYHNPIQAFHEIMASLLNPDVILLDLQLKGIDYTQYLKQIKGKPNCKSVVFGITNQSALLTIQDIKNLKKYLDDAFETPIEAEQFLLKINTNLSERPLVSKKSFQKREVLKRMVDFTCSGIVLLVLSPLLIVIALAIKIDSKGPVFFVSPRVGRKYAVFSFYKFRTMKTGAELLVDSMKAFNQYAHKKQEIVEKCPDCEKLQQACSPLLIVDGKEICEVHHKRLLETTQASFLKIKNDPRVTKLGHFLRNTSLDELPQLFNILKGDMSFVGNRPLPIYEAEQLTTDEWATRFDAPAGLTGLWQVRKRGKGDMSELERKQLDNSYARNHTFLKDIILIFKTIPALLQKENV